MKEEQRKMATMERKASPGGQKRVEDKGVGPCLLGPGHLLEQYHVMVRNSTKLWLPLILALGSRKGEAGGGQND